MSSIRQMTVNNRNGLDMNVNYCGEQHAQPLVVLLHGYPETGLSCFRHQLPALGEAGYFTVAPDQRGFGKTTGWDAGDKGAFSALNLMKDILGLVFALGYNRCVVVGHDFGTSPAFYAALFRPDVFQALFLMSVPLGPVPTSVEGADLVELKYASLRKKGLLHYQDLYSQADTAQLLERNLEEYLRGTMHVMAGGSPAMKAFSMDGPPARLMPMVNKIGVAYLGVLAPYSSKPFAAGAWQTEEQFRELVQNYQRTGLQGALNWYANIGKNVKDMQIMARGRLRVPYYFLGGKDDFCVPMYQSMYDSLDAGTMDQFQGKRLLPDVGHWITSEAPEIVNTELLQFLSSVYRSKARL